MVITHESLNTRIKEIVNELEGIKGHEANKIDFKYLDKYNLREKEKLLFRLEVALDHARHTISYANRVEGRNRTWAYMSTDKHKKD